MRFRQIIATGRAYFATCDLCACKGPSERTRARARASAQEEGWCTRRVPPSGIRFVTTCLECSVRALFVVSTAADVRGPYRTLERAKEMNGHVNCLIWRVNMDDSAAAVCKFSSRPRPPKAERAKRLDAGLSEIRALRERGLE